MKIFANVLLSFIIANAVETRDSYADPTSETSTIDQILALAKPLESDRVYYRWQEKAEGDLLVKEGDLTNERYSSIMRGKSKPRDAYAGRGMYVEENPASQSAKMKDISGGSLIEVRIQKGTPYLDLTNPKTLDALNAKGVFPEMIYQSNPPVALKYYGEGSDWWNLKNQKGVSFHTFDGSGLKNDELLAMYDKINVFDNGNAASIFQRAVKETVFKRLDNDSALLFSTKLLPLVDDEQILKLVENQGSRINDLKAALDLEKKISASPALRYRAEHIPQFKAAMKNVQTRVTPIADVLEKYGHSDIETPESILSRKFSLARSPEEVLRYAEELQAALKNHDPGFIRKLHAVDIVSLGSNDKLGAAHRKKLGEISASLKAASQTTEDALVEALSKDPGPGHFADLILDAANSNIPSSGPFGERVKRILEQRGYAGDPGINTSADLLRYKNWLLETVSGPAQFVQLANLRLPSGDTRSDEFVRANMDRFVRMNPSVKQYKEIRPKLNLDVALETQAKMYPLVKTADDVLGLLEYDKVHYYRGQNDVTSAGKRALDQSVAEFLKRQPDSFLNANTSLDQFYEIKKHISDVDTMMALQGRMLSQVKTTQDYIHLSLIAPSDVGPDSRSWNTLNDDYYHGNYFNSEYYARQREFTCANFDRFIETNPSLADFAQLKNERLVNVGDGALYAAQEKMLAFVKKPGDFITLVKSPKVAWPTSSANSGQYTAYRDIQQQFTKDHLSKFLATNPTKAQIQELASTIGSANSHLLRDPAVEAYRHTPAGRQACPTLFGRIENLLGK